MQHLWLQKSSGNAGNYKADWKKKVDKDKSGIITVKGRDTAGILAENFIGNLLLTTMGLQDLEERAGISQQNLNKLIKPPWRITKSPLSLPKLISKG